MPITVKCPDCRRVYNVGDDKAGKRMKCQGCGAVVTIPEVLDEAIFLDDDEPQVESAAASRRASFSGAARSAQPAGLRSPKVQYIGGGSLIAVAVVIVIVILHQRGFLDDNDHDEEPVVVPPTAAKSRSEFERQNYGLTLDDDFPLRRSVPTHYRAGYELQVFRDDAKLAVVRGGSVGAKPAGRIPFRERLSIRPPGPDGPAAKRADAERLKRIAAATKAYYEKNGVYPSPYTRTHQLSWRVHLLPFLGEQKLFEQFRLNEPWDSPHNAALIPKMPDVFKTAEATRQGMTTTHLFVGQHTPFRFSMPKAEKATYEGGLKYWIYEEKFVRNAQYVFKLDIYPRGDRKDPVTLIKKLHGTDMKSGSRLNWKVVVPIRMEDYAAPTAKFITDGLSTTMNYVIAGPESSAEWTRPGGLSFERFNPFPAMGTISADGFLAVMFDGRVVNVPASIESDEFRKAVQHDDGQFLKEFPPR